MCDCECALKNNAKFRISREIFALIYQKALGQNKKPEKRSAQREPKYRNKKKEGNAKFAKRCRKNAPHKMANKSNKPTIFRTIFFSSASGINTFELTRQGRWTHRRMGTGGWRQEVGEWVQGTKAASMCRTATLSFFICGQLGPFRQLFGPVTSVSRKRAIFICAANTNAFYVRC